MKISLLALCASVGAMTMTSSVAAREWVTYAQEKKTGSSAWFWTYQFDLSSLGRRKEWIYAEHRMCPSEKSFRDTLPCKNAIIQFYGAQCSDGLMDVNGIRLIRHLRGKWLWLNDFNSEPRFNNIGRSEVNPQTTKAFKFLCS